MKIQHILAGMLTVVTLGGLIFAPVNAGAQRWRDRPEGRGRDWRNGRYSREEIRRIIDRVEENSNAFRDLYERSLRNGVLPGTEHYDNLKAKIQRLDESLERLRHEYDRNRDWRDTRSQVADVLQNARAVDRVIHLRSRVESRLGYRWDRIRFELNALADVYDLSRV